MYQYVVWFPSGMKKLQRVGFVHAENKYGYIVDGTTLMCGHVKYSNVVKVRTTKLAMG